MNSADMVTLREELEGLAPQPPSADVLSHTLASSSTDQPQSLLDSISQQLNDLDRQEEDFIRSTNRKRLELKRLWNSTLPIHKLPHELLIKLFIDFWGAIESYHCSSINIVGDWMFCKGWQDLMLVCRYWRDILVATPAFWREINLGRQINWIQLCLARSSPAPIEVTARYQTQCALEVIFPHAHRFRTFCCKIACGPQLQRALPYFFSGGMPHLEDLNFGAVQQPPMQSDIVDLDLTSQRFPCLQALELEGQTMVAPRDVSLYAQLRKLSLSMCSHNLSFDGFLDALATCARLEQLTLSSTLHRLSGEWAHTSGPGPRRPPISLPRLRKFTSIDHGVLRTSRFLAHLYLQSSVVLEIEAGLHGPLSDLTALNPVQNVRAMLPPDRLATLPILAVATYVEVLVTYDGYEIGCGYAHPVDLLTCSLLSGFIVTKGELRWHDFLIEGLDDLVECFGRAPLTHLKVEAVKTHATVDVWERVFRTFPRLEVLEIGGEIEVSGVFLGLHAASTTRADPQSPVACPNLRKVRVNGCGTVAVYEAMRDCLQCRADRGAVLDVLDLEVVFNGVDLTSEARCLFIENIRQVVNHVHVTDNQPDEDDDGAAWDDE